MRISDEQVARGVADAREWADVSQAELARRLKARGVEGFYPSTIAKIERGQRSLKLNEAIEIAEVLGVDVSDLVESEGGKWLPDRRVAALAKMVLGAHEEAAGALASLMELRELYLVLAIDRFSGPFTTETEVMRSLADAATVETVADRAKVLLEHGRSGQMSAPPPAFEVRWSEGLIEVKKPGDDTFTFVDPATDWSPDSLRNLLEASASLLDPPKGQREVEYTGTPASESPQKPKPQTSWMVAPVPGGGWRARMGRDPDAPMSRTYATREEAIELFIRPHAPEVADHLLELDDKRGLGVPEQWVTEDEQGRLQVSAGGESDGVDPEA